MYNTRVRFIKNVLHLWRIALIVGHRAFVSMSSAGMKISSACYQLRRETASHHAGLIFISTHVRHFFKNNINIQIQA